jgi:RNA polymerase sigma-70 factor (ECF subfamily)
MVDVNQPQSELDQTIRQACESGDFQRAATKALEAHGPEVLSFLVARLHTRSDGEEAFSMFAEDLWKGLPGFAFRCSVRGWLYTVARNAANRYATSPHNRARKNLNVSLQESVAELVQVGRSATQAHKRTDVKERLRALREKLPLEDQTLLILHVDRDLPWRELAMVMHERGELLDGEALVSESARLRKRFERVKASLRELAVADGLLKARDHHDK